MTALSEQAALKILREAVAISSPSGHERAVAEYVVQQAAALGWQSSIDPAGNVLAERGTGHPIIYFLGHIDTVPGEIPVRIEAGKLYGRGAVDAKGPLAAFLCGATRVAADFPGTITIIGAVEEEASSSKGAHFAVETYPAPDFLIIGEPSGWEKLTLGYKGRVHLTYHLRQERTHGASQVPSVGTRSCELFHHIDALPEIAKITAQSPFFSVNKNVRLITTTHDPFYETVEMALDIRVPPDVHLEKLMQELSALDHPGQIDICEGLEAVHCPKSGSLVAAFRKAIKANGGTPRTSLKTGTSDMNIAVPAWKCPCLAYGPGDSNLDHTPHEHIVLEEYQRSIQVIHTALTSLADRERT
ncbi:[LysW]-lysine hydrolase [candidate division KSB3 bacterium]|uniref:[LysW]-lysine hydrolase n=1 Tax=candidate division KSB3 bacterium TaxID=2044937 RepID=A0A9D5JXP3_9BACT|nr:[LysW]-lysine hydrolase [candidate division KSB3 bacterium]MBD3325747.1 [LysW]-lysine hydrolase [candidate division KSB3 bacterium]